MTDEAGFRRTQAPKQSEIGMIDLGCGPVSGGEAGELFRRSVTGVTLCPLKTVLEADAELKTGGSDFFGIVKCVTLGTPSLAAVMKIERYTTAVGQFCRVTSLTFLAEDHSGKRTSAGIGP